MFRKTILYMIWKSKGPQEIMKNNRFIHMKEHYLPRTVESIVVNVMKEDILDKSTMYQVGGQPGHSTDEHLFAIRSLIELLEARGQGMVFTLVDLVAFFDREDLYDAVATLYQTGVNSDAIRLWCKPNQNTQIRIKTSAGMTETVDVGNVGSLGIPAEPAQVLCWQCS